MPTNTPRLAIPYPNTSDQFKPASVDLPALANRVDVIAAREPASVLADVQVGSVGASGQKVAGRDLLVADFQTLLALPVAAAQTPVALYNLANVNDSSGNALTLTNKGTVTFGVGIGGAASTAAQFAGSTGQAFYIADAGAGDAFRLGVLSVGCWTRTAKRLTGQGLVSKWRDAGNLRCWLLSIDASTPAGQLWISTNGTNAFAATGTTDICDDRWHFVVGTYDGDTIRIYVDGRLEGMTPTGGHVAGLAAPFNVGGFAADGSTVTTQPHFGMIDEAFVLPHVLSIEQIRLLYASKTAHGLGYTPTRAHLAVRRKRRGAPAATTDLVTPLRLYNFATADPNNDEGTNNQDLTVVNAPALTTGADGRPSHARRFVAASSQYAGATDAGLPSGATVRTFGCWVKRPLPLPTGLEKIIAWGTPTTNQQNYLDLTTSGTVRVGDTSNTVTSPFSIVDGEWHFVVARISNTPSDGQTTKLYVDGRLVQASTTQIGVALTLAGADAFRIGRALGAGTEYLNGAVDMAFVDSNGWLAADVQRVYNLGAQALAPSPADESLYVEAFDATSVYTVLEDVGGQNSVDLRVAG